MAEVVQSQVLHLHVIAFRAEAELVWRRDVVKLTVVAGGHGFKAVANEVSIELHKQADEGQVIGWNILFKLPLVGIAEGWVERGLQPRVNTIDAHHCLELIRIVALIEELSVSVRGNLRVFGASLRNFYELGRVTKLITEAVLHGVVTFLIPLDLMVEQLALPVVVPSLSCFIPDARARLRLIITNTSDIILAIVAHIDISVTQKLLIGSQEVTAHSLCEFFL